MRTTVREALIDIDTPVPSPSWALLERSSWTPRQGVRVLRALLRRAGLPPLRAPLVRRRRPRRRAGELAQLDDAARAGRRRPRPRALQEGPGRPLPPVHRGQDHRRAAGPRWHVLPGVPRLLRLDAPRRGMVADRPTGPLRSRRRRPAAPPAPLVGLVHGREPAHPQLRPRSTASSPPSSMARAGP